MIPDLLCGFDAPVSPKNPESRQRRRISEALRRPGDGMPMGMAGGAVCSFYTGLLVRRAIRGTVIVIVVTIVPRPAARRRDARHGRETCTRPRIASPSAIGRIARIDPANKNSLKLASDPDARRGCRADWSLAGHVAGAPAYAVRRTPTPQVTRRIAVVPPARQRPTPDARTLDGPRSIALLRSLCAHDARRVSGLAYMSRVPSPSRGSRHRILQPVRLRVKSMSHVNIRIEWSELGLPHRRA